VVDQPLEVLRLRERDVDHRPLQRRLRREVDAELEDDVWIGWAVLRASSMLLRKLVPCGRDASKAISSLEMAVMLSVKFSPSALPWTAGKRMSSRMG
jgi:hypothetical protein